MDRIAIIGGSSSFGHGFVDYLSKNNISNIELIIYSRDEAKQQQMKGYCKSKSIPAIFAIGDIRDKQRLLEVLGGRVTPSSVIIAAAMKHIDLCEANPMEAIKTNIIGVQNVIDVCKQVNSIRNCIFLSADKAVAPAGMYGYTKAIGESLMAHAGADSSCSFVSIRYSNVLGSRGSVIQTFQDILDKKGTIKVFGSDMCRLVITQEEVAEMVWCVIEHRQPLDQVYLKKSPKIYIKDLAQAMVELIGKGNYEVIDTKRSGEKDDALLYTAEESKNLVGLGNDILAIRHSGAYPTIPVESYGTHNARTLTLDEIKEIVKPLISIN